MPKLRRAVWKKSAGRGLDVETPHVAKNGRESYRVGYYDHDGVERTGTFHSKRARSQFLRDYGKYADEAALLERFLLETFRPDVLRQREQAERVPTISELIWDYLALHADPALPGGLSENAFNVYVSVARNHICPQRPERPPKGWTPLIGEMPVSDFEDQAPVVRWQHALEQRGVSKATRTKARTVLSGALSWAIMREDYPVRRNGARDLPTSNRRSSRRGGTGASATDEHDNDAAYALTPEAVERIRAELLVAKVRPGNEHYRLRAAFFVALQHALGCRNQEVWALRFRHVGVYGPDKNRNWVHIRRVLSWNDLDDGKTRYAKRVAAVPSYIIEHDLPAWRAECERVGLPCGPDDFLFAGNHPRGHATVDQARQFGSRYFGPAVERVVKEHPHLAGILGATLYSLRRGGISLRIRAGDDPGQVSKQCGTSLRMIDEHYLHALDMDGPPRAFEAEVAAARRLVFGREWRAAALRHDTTPTSAKVKNASRQPSRSNALASRVPQQPTSAHPPVSRRRGARAGRRRAA